MYETNTASSISDLMSKLNTFAAANGWTVDHSASDRLFLTRSTVSVAFRWASSSPTGFGVYQHKTFINSSTDPGSHTDDSGQGAVSGVDATIMAARSVPIPNSAMMYWFFEADTYLHVVLESASAAGTYVHFGFGLLTKFGTWTGGAYAYGWRRPAGGANGFDSVTTILLSGAAGVTLDTTVRPWVATVNVESLPNQTASGKWGLAWAGTLANTSTDRGGTARENLQGGYQGGPTARAFARFGGAIGNGLNPLYTMPVWYDDRTQARWYPLGYHPDVRGFNMRNYAAAQELVIGSDTWVVFPAHRLPSVSPTVNSQNAGIAYLKVTT